MRLVIVLLLTIAIVQVLTPSSVSAQQSANNTAVFSGQFIPAFVGTAYDPSAAYQRMAGLPVYVFAYDSWAGSAYILNNLAVRTQIRADGSFQAQGLPNGQKFGVYFPFKAEGNPVTTVRTDCINGNDDAGSPTCANSILGPDAPFRMPQLDNPLGSNYDGISDVFSFNMADAAAQGVTNIRDQLGQPLRLGLTYLTQETRVDIENNINTFPLIPTNTLKVTTKNILFENSAVNMLDDSAYEIVAERYLFDNGGDGYLLPGDNLQIKGRTSNPIEAQVNAAAPEKNDRVFMAYAPPGIYAVTIWRREGSVNYTDYNPVIDTKNAINPQLKSSQIGFGILRVHPDRNRDGTTDFSRDWFMVRGVKNNIFVLNNRFITWGTVTSESGLVLTPSRQAFDVSVSLSTDREIRFKPKHRQICSVDGPWSYYDTPATCSGDISNPGTTLSSGTTNVRDIAHINGSPTASSYGTYVLYDYERAADHLNDIRIGGSKALTMKPYTISSSATHEPENTADSNQIFSSDGPLRINLQLTTQITDGQVVNVQLGSTGNLTDFRYKPEAAYARLQKVVNDEYEVRVDEQIYYANARGKIVIPHGDFVPFNVGEALFDGTHVLPTYALIVGAPNMKERGYGLQYNGTGSAPINVTLDELAYVKPKGYRLLGFIPANFLIPGLSEAIAADLHNADVVINFKDAPPIQSITYHDGEGNLIGSYDETTITETGEYSLPLSLPYSNPEGRCPDVAAEVVSNPIVSAVTGFLGVDVEAAVESSCEIVTSKTNTVSIRVTGNEENFQQSFAIRPAEGTGIATASPNSWDVNFKSNCEILSENLWNEFYARHSKSPEDAEDLNKLERIAIATTNVPELITDIGVPNFGCKVAAGISSMVSSGLQTLKNILILEPLTISNGVIETWNAIRGMANIIIIFILLLIGINHALGYDIKNWGANIMLPKLIIATILGNLTVLIVQGVLDVNNILTSWIFSIAFDVLQNTGISPNAIAIGSAATAAAGAYAVIGAAMSGAISGAIASVVGSGGSILIPIIGAILALALTMLALLISLLAVFYGRYLIIWILTMIAPLVFALSILPWFSSIRNLWWKTLLPLATMQTVTAVFISMGILLLGKSFEGDSFVVQIGGVLIGGATLFLSLKSPQISTQFLGGGGMAAQALGMLQGVSKGLSGKIQNAASGVSEYTSLDALEERREKGRIRTAVAKGRDSRMEREAAERGEKYVKPVFERLPFAGTRLAEAKEKRERKFDASLKKVEAAGNAAGADLDYNLPTTDTPLLKRLYGGQQYAASEQQLRKKVLPSVDIVGRTGLGAQQQKAIHTGLDLSINDPNRVINFGRLPQYSGGKIARWSKTEVDSGIAPVGTKAGAVKFDAHEFRGTHAQYLAELGRRSGNASLGSVKSASELKKAPGDAHGIYMEAMALALKQNPADVQGALPPLPGQRDRRDIQGLKKLYQEGARYNRDFAATPTPAAPSGGGGGTGGGGGRTP